MYFFEKKEKRKKDTIFYFNAFVILLSKYYTVENLKYPSNVHIITIIIYYARSAVLSSAWAFNPPGASRNRWPGASCVVAIVIGIVIHISRWFLPRFRVGETAFLIPRTAEFRHDFHVRSGERCCCCITNAHT